MVKLFVIVCAELGEIIHQMMLIPTTRALHEYLSLGWVLCSRVHEDSSVLQSAVNVSHHGAYVTRSVGLPVLKHHMETFVLKNSSLQNCSGKSDEHFYCKMLFHIKASQEFIGMIHLSLNEFTIKQYYDHSVFFTRNCSFKQLQGLIHFSSTTLFYTIIWLVLWRLNFFG